MYLNDVLFRVVDYLFTNDSISSLIIFRSVCSKYFSIVEKYLFKLRFVDYRVVRLVFHRHILENINVSEVINFHSWMSYEFLPDVFADVDYDVATHQHQLNIAFFDCNNLVYHIYLQDISFLEILKPSQQRLDPLFVLDKLLLIFLDKKTRLGIIFHFDVQFNNENEKMFMNLIKSTKYLPHKYHSIVDNFYLPLKSKAYNFYNHNFISVLQMNKEKWVFTSVMKNDSSKIISLPITDREEIRTTLFESSYKPMFFHSTHPYILVLQWPTKTQASSNVIIIIHLSLNRIFTVETTWTYRPCFTNDLKSLWFLADGCLVLLEITRTTIVPQERLMNVGIKDSKFIMTGRDSLRFFGLNSKNKHFTFPIGKLRKIDDSDFKVLKIDKIDQSH